MSLKFSMHVDTYSSFALMAVQKKLLAFNSKWFHLGAILDNFQIESEM